MRTYVGFWGAYGELMGNLWGAYGTSFVRANVLSKHEAVQLIGSMGAYGDFQDLLMGLRCQPYGDLWGSCGCGVGLMGIYGVLWLR